MICQFVLVYAKDGVENFDVFWKDEYCVVETFGPKAGKEVWRYDEVGAKLPNGKSREQVYKELVAAKARAPLTQEVVRAILDDPYVQSIQCESCSTKGLEVALHYYDGEYDHYFCKGCIQKALDLFPKE